MTVRSFSRIRQLEPLAAIQALSHMEAQEHVLSTLAWYLSHPEPMVRVEAVRALVGMGPAAVPNLLPALRDDCGAVRREAAADLGRLGPDAAPAVDDLAVLLRDDDVRVRTAATLTLGLMGPAAEAAVPGLIRVLAGPHLILSRLAAQSLSRIGLAAVPSLTGALRSGDKYARREAAWALGEIGPAIANATTLDELAEWRSTAERSAAVPVCAAESHATVMLNLGETVAVPDLPIGEAPVFEPASDPLGTLAAALRDEDAKVREAASRALRRIRGENGKVCCPSQV
jgi:HEAT repeat protein